MKITWLVKKIIQIAQISGTFILFASSGVFLFTAQTWVGRLSGILAVTLCLLPVLQYFGCQSKKSRPFSTFIRIYVLCWFCALFYVVGFAPSGKPYRSPISHEYASDKIYNRFSIFSIIPEIDQVNFVLTLVPYVDTKITLEQANRVKRLTNNIYRKLNTNEEFQQLGSVLSLCYADALGLPFNQGHYYLYVPKRYQGEQPIPVVVFLHGSLGNFKGYYWILAKLAEENGMAIVAPSYGVGNWREEDALKLIKDSLKDAAKKIVIDQNNIYLSGISNGGLGVTRFAVDDPGMFKGLIYLSPVFDYSIMDNPRFAQQWSGKSILVISGKADQRIPVAYLQERATVLQDKGVDVKEVYYDNEDHFLLFSQPDMVLKEISRWLDQQLPL